MFAAASDGDTIFKHPFKDAQKDADTQPEVDLYRHICLENRTQHRLSQPRLVTGRHHIPDKVLTPVEILHLPSLTAQVLNSDLCPEIKYSEKRVASKSFA